MKISEVFDSGRSRIVEIATPKPGANEVLVRVDSCGICGSEYLPWKQGIQGMQGMQGGRLPLRLGHEVAGEIIEIGPGVSDLALGDRVTGFFREGFAESALAPARAVVKIPNQLSYMQAALGEPISCVVSGALRTDIGLGKTVVVIGLGFMGLMALQLMRLKGALRLIAIDTRMESKHIAIQLGADEFYSPDRIPEDLMLADSSGSGGVDVVVECTGNGKALDCAVVMVKRHGILSIVGYHQDGLRSVDFGLLNRKAVDIVNAHEKREDFKVACMKTGLALVVGGQLVIDPLITHAYGLESVDAAFEDFAVKPGGYIKGVVRVEP
jgi:threonine dehydrogenase-like Zn-dependent dehydrogenase